MKKILWIQTGGTFDCRATPRGLSPHEVSVNTGSPANSCSDLHEIDELRLFAADSTDITPAHWKILARAVFEHAQNPAYRAFIITHGTDTMQYTAAALSLMLENFDKPVILTGASKAPATKDSDAAANFSAAIGAIAGLQCGVYVVFGGKIIPGLCAIKLNSHTCEFIDAALTSFPEKPNPHAPPILRDKLCEDVFYLKITPQIHPDIADFLLEKGYKGVICECYGLGGIPPALLEKLGALVTGGVRVIAVSQCLQGGANLQIYAAHKRAADLGIEAWNMTGAGALARLMLELGEAM